MMAPHDRTPPKFRIGLCFDCANARRVESDRGATFYLCKLAKVDPSFRKYPALPVLVCSGFKTKPESPR
jgi:hypothetical protein